VARIYHVYGVALTSQWALPCSKIAGHSVASVALVRGATSTFAAAAKMVAAAKPAGPFHQTLADGVTYLRWDRHFEFLVEDGGRRIAARSLRSIPSPAFDSYLLGPALSFALLKQGVEPLHATTVVIDGQGIGFLGDSGYGKSSLAAWFVRAGCRLLTDDLQVMAQHRGQLLAYPGPPRLKLFRRVAETILRARHGVALDSPFAPKLVITLSSRQSCNHPVPLRALYVLGAPSRAPGTRVILTKLSSRRAFVELVRNTFNTTIADRARMERQLAWCAQVASSVPVMRVSYPRRWRMLSAVHESILADLARLPVSSTHV
jgi:hypothetical protein